MDMIYDKDGIQVLYAYNKSGNTLLKAYGVDGNEVYQTRTLPDYSNYLYTQKWTSKGISNTQGFDIYADKVFWVSKSGNASIPATCYVWNLSDGSQAYDTAYITIQSGHGNNLCFAYPNLYATSAYPPSSCYVNAVSSNLKIFTLDKTLSFNDGSTDCDACIDENDSSILWTLGHTAGSSDTSAPYYISKWNLNSLTENQDGTYTPELIQTTSTPQPSNSYYFQGCKFHDGLLWYANGYSGTSTGAYVFGVNPNNGTVLYSINCNTTAEPEGVAWVEDVEAVGGYAMYVGFQGMMMRKYTFAELN